MCRWGQWVHFIVSDIDDCPGQDCQNNAPCVDGVNTFTCNCAGTGYDGNKCQNSKYLVLVETLDMMDSIVQTVSWNRCIKSNVCLIIRLCAKKCCLVFNHQLYVKYNVKFNIIKT